jgi:acetyl-CoA C-acetyltransferase
VQPADVGDVILGCVLQAGNGMNVARQAAFRAGLPAETPAESVNRVCGSGLQAVVHAVEAIRVGYTPVVVAGGTESMSNAPYVMRGARWGLRMGHGEVLDTMIADGLTCAIGACHMGNTAEEVAKRYGVSRQTQDQVALVSQQRIAAAQHSGFFTHEIAAMPVTRAILDKKSGERVGEEAHLADRDECNRADTTLEGLHKLPPVFDTTSGAGSVTAGNSSQLSDGASATLLMSRARAEQLGISPMLVYRGYAVAACEPDEMGIGPVFAVPKLLARHGLQVEHVDLWELHEAFAS